VEVIAAFAIRPQPVGLVQPDMAMLLEFALPVPSMST